MAVTIEDMAMAAAKACNSTDFCPFNWTYCVCTDEPCIKCTPEHWMKDLYQITIDKAFSSFCPKCGEGTISLHMQNDYPACFECSKCGHSWDIPISQSKTELFNKREYIKNRDREQSGKTEIEIKPRQSDANGSDVPHPNKCKYCGSKRIESEIQTNHFHTKCMDCGKTLFEWHKSKDNQDRPKFKTVICKLVDKDDHEICCGGCFAHDEHIKDDTPFEEFEKEANKSLLFNFGEAICTKLPSCANKTQDELKNIMDAMIALEDYKIEWFYCGWDDKDENNA